MDKRYQVFISSTYMDLKEERKAIIEGLLNSEYIPAGMEMFSASNDEQFKYIKKIIDTCDYYILIVGARYGSINSATGKSFTELEYDYAIERGIPVLAFLHNDPDNLPVGKREDRKRKSLEKFRSKVSIGRMNKTWNTLSELVTSVIISLNHEVKVNPRKGWIRGDISNNSEFLSKINEFKSKIDEKEEEIVKLKKTLETYIDLPNNLANENDYYKVIGYCRYQGADQLGNRLSYDSNGEIYMTWNNIFSAIGPYLISYINFYDFSEKLKIALNSYCVDKFFFISINENCIQTIKMHLVALGLINITPMQSTSGGVIEFIGLTEKGNIHLIQLKSVKRG